MDIQTIPRLNRAKDILITLIKYGFGDIVDRLEIRNRLIPFKVKKHEYSNKSTWERITLVLTELGPTFIKFGQILSLRPDIIPESLINELSKLQDDVAPESFSDIKHKVENSLQKPLEETFSDFEATPLAAASLAQVHRAVLTDKNKTVVAVKVQRPGIKRIIKRDLDILAVLAKQVHERIEFLRIYDFPMLVEEIKQLLLSELDFDKEAKNIRLARNNFSKEPNLYFPQTYPEYSSSQVLVMELIQGTQLKHAKNLPVKEKRRLAKVGINFTLEQILVHGFFHADPHPGNIFITGEKTITYIDFGMVGRITEEDRDLMALLFYALINKKINVLMDVILILGKKPDDFNRRRFQLDMEKILDRYYGSDLANIEIKAVFEDLQYFIYEHQIRMPQDFFLLFRAIAVSEGVGQDLDPDFNVVEVGKDFISEILDDRMQFDKIISRVGSEIWKLGRKKYEFNSQLKSILRKLEEDDFTINFRHTNLENLISRLDIISNRLSMSLIIASLIIGSTLLIQTNMEPRIFNIPLLGFIGYSFAGVLGLLLVISIFRSGKY